MVQSIPGSIPVPWLEKKDKPGYSRHRQMEPEVRNIIARVHDLFKGRTVTLSVAESCTGGLISHYLTVLPGASAFFTLGIVSYSEQVKKDILGISAETIQRHGVVSEEVAREMAERVRLLSKSDYAVSSTGNIGPGVLEGKSMGLVYVAASKEGRTVSLKVLLQGKRETNKEDAALAALRLLIKLVEE